MKPASRLGGIVALLWAACGVPAFGQWTQQTFQLQTGWNSIYLEIDPVPAEADALFAGKPITAVWMRMEDSGASPTSPNCTDPNDPSCAAANDTLWRQWVPPADPGAFLNTLRLIRGGQVYLINATAAATLTLTGKPNPASTRYHQGFNLTGFHVDPDGAPSFQTYLAPAAAPKNVRIFTVQTNGALLEVTSLTNPITVGKGYWVKADAETRYDGPVTIDADSLRGFDFDRDFVSRSMTLKNETALEQPITVSYLASAAAPAGTPTLAGDVPLKWLDYGTGSYAEQLFLYTPLGTREWQFAAAGETAGRQVMKVTVNRVGLEGATVNPDGTGSQYQGLLVVTDGRGFRRVLPVAAQVPEASVGALSGYRLFADGTNAVTVGLWVGRVTVNQVSWVTAPLSGDADWTTPRDTGHSEFAFPIIIHHDSSDVYRMLTEVSLMYHRVDNPDPEPDTGWYVLVTPSCTTCTGLEPGGYQEGSDFVPRMATAAFAFDEDLELTGGGFTSTLSGTTTLAKDHRLNPYRHKYHPDHEEGYEITRTFTLTFHATPPLGVVSAGYGERVLAGEYTETLQGLHKEDIYVAGRFELARLLQISTLNDGQ